MRRNALIFAILLSVANAAAAQISATQPRFDVAATAGLTEARPPETPTSYYQDWYADGRFAGSIGYYWNKNIKTEFEHAWTAEGSRSVFEYSTVRGQPYPIQYEQFFQLQQTTLRMVWQFGDNQWVHPYVSAGAVLDVERQRLHRPVIHQLDALGRPVVVPEQRDFDKHTEYRGGVALGFGTKLYMSPRAFFNTGVNVTYSRPDSGTVNLFAGFGIDF
jgi:hypothetical protein